MRERCRSGRREQPGQERIGNRRVAEHHPGSRVTDRPGHRHDSEQQRHGDARSGRGGHRPRRPGPHDEHRASDQRRRDRSHGHPPGVALGPAARPVAQPARDDVRDVIERHRGQLLAVRAQIDDLAIAQADLHRRHGRREGPFAESLQHPPALFAHHVGPVQARVLGDRWEQICERHVAGKRDVHPPGRPDHGDPAHFCSAWRSHWPPFLSPPYIWFTFPHCPRCRKCGRRMITRCSADQPGLSR